MAYARHLMPQIGLLAPDVWYCTAFGGHGMNTASIGGRVVAEGITGDSHRYQLFQPFRTGLERRRAGPGGGPAHILVLSSARLVAGRRSR